MGNVQKNTNYVVANQTPLIIPLKHGSVGLRCHMMKNQICNTFIFLTQCQNANAMKATHLLQCKLCANLIILHTNIHILHLCTGLKMYCKSDFSSCVPTEMKSKSCRS